ncbi:MAG: hypothetical protein AB7O52_17605 [Planctomycetota bacterium]
MGEIVLSINTDKLHTTVKKASTVSSNDPNRSTLPLSLGGQVQALLEVKPAQVKLSGLASDIKELDVELEKGSDLMVEILGIEATRGLVEVTSIDTIEPGAKYSIHLTAAASEKPVMDRDTLKVSVRTSDGQQRETQVAVLIENLDRIVLTPRNNIVFRQQQAATLRDSKVSASQSLFLSSAKPGITFQVTGVEIVDAPEGLFEAEFKEVTPGERYRVTVNLLKYLDVPNVRGKLRVHTDDPKSPVQEVNLFAQFGAPQMPAGRQGEVKPAVPNPNAKKELVDPKSKGQK